MPALAWTLPTLRKAWNQAKTEVVPWWPNCSKEAYGSGIADLVAALNAWSTSKHDRRAGPKVGFPRFKARHRDRSRVRFHTGTMRLEPDRRHLILPAMGRLRCMENTRRLERLVAKGRARALSMTSSEQGGRLFISVNTIIAQVPRTPWEPNGRCGIDLGIGSEWAVIAHADDTIERITHPAPWATVRQRRGPPGRRPAASLVPRGHRQAKAKLALDRRGGQPAPRVHPYPHHHPRPPLRHDRGRKPGRCGDGPSYGPACVPPRLPGRVAESARSWAYKTSWAGGRLVVADRWFTSSKTHHGCSGYRADLALKERQWVCPRCGGSGPQRQCGLQSP